MAGTFLKYYLFAVLAFFPIDMLWLGWLARGLYQRQIGQWMGDTDWTAALIFYLMFLAGLVYFVIWDVPEATGMIILLRGAFFGVITYGTYELTNKAVIAGWPLKIVIIDILWGAVLCAVVSWVSWYFGR